MVHGAKRPWWYMKCKVTCFFTWRLITLEKPGGGGLDSGGMCKVKCFLTWRLITLEPPNGGVGMVPWRCGVRMEPLCKAMRFLTWRLVMLERPAGGGGVVPWQYVKCKVLCFFCLNVDNAGMAHWWWEEILMVCDVQGSSMCLLT